MNRDDDDPIWILLTNGKPLLTPRPDADQLIKNGEATDWPLDKKLPDWKDQ